MTKKPNQIVLCQKYNNSRDVVFMMEHGDAAERNEMMGNDNYTIIGEVDHISKHTEHMIDDNGRNFKVVTSTNQVTYRLFSDWSMRQVW